MNKQLTVAFATKHRLKKALVISVCYMKPKDLIACQVKCFCFFYK